ncbi:MAG: HD-GYP domain-containing protein [Kiloniellaceae bacterium]
MGASARGEGAVPSDFLSGDIDISNPGPERAHTLVRGAWVVAVVVALAVLVPAVAIHLKWLEILGELERRLEILARGRAEVVAAWLDGVTRPVDRVVDSEMFRLFATEVDLARGDVSDLAAGAAARPQNADPPAGLGAPLAAQIPFMAQVLSDFAENAGFLAGHLIDRDGAAYVSSAGAPALGAEQRAVAAGVFQSGVLRYGPVRATPAGLVLDLFAPVFRAQSETGRDSPVAVLMLSAPATAGLSALLAPPPLSEPGERVRLLQMAGGAFYEIAPGGAPPLRAVEPFRLSAAERTIPFAKRRGVAEDEALYSVGAAVSGPAWWVVQEIDAEAAAARLDGFITAVLAVAVLVVLTVVAAFGAFWWRMANEHSAALAEQFRRLAGRIDAQKRLLDSINDTITDYIGLKSLDGTYRYVNPAFARAMDRDVRGAVGLDDAAIFGKGTADRLKHSDQRALASGAPVTVSEEVYLGARARHLQVTKVPYRDDNGALAGIVSVTRDVTDLVEEQKKRERAVRQTVAALVRAVELRDPYLAGHSRRVAGFAGAVAQRLGAGPEDVATVEIAANLSQIGKLGVPREILTKSKRLTKAEIAQMQRHVEHAAEVLRGIDFDLPVIETIAQMHERLDGGGYPEGLSGDRVRLTARVLGVCDVFCARIEPRAYRRAISADAALEILERNGDRYDPAVVAALRDVVGSVAGDKLMAGLGAS